MSSILLRDGKGSGNHAEVDEHGRLYTRSNPISHMSHHATAHKNGFVAVYNTTLTGTSPTPVMHFDNIATGKEAEIYWLKVSSDKAVEVLVYLGGTFTSGGNAVVMSNTYVGNGTTSNTSTKEGGTGNLVLNLNTASEVDGAFIEANGTVKFEYDGGIVIPSGKQFSILAVGASGDKIKVTLGLSLHDVGVSL